MQANVLSQRFSMKKMKLWSSYRCTSHRANCDARVTYRVSHERLAHLKCARPYKTHIQFAQCGQQSDRSSYHQVMFVVSMLRQPNCRAYRTDCKIQWSMERLRRVQCLRGRSLHKMSMPSLHVRLVCGNVHVRDLLTNLASCHECVKNHGDVECDYLS